MGRQSANYEAEITVEVPTPPPTPPRSLTSKRGWTAVDGQLAGQPFRFVNTHLEAALDSTRARRRPNCLRLEAQCACDGRCSSWAT
jgi:hypothetical protein